MTTKKRHVPRWVFFRDARRASFRVIPRKVENVHATVRAALGAGGMSDPQAASVAGKFSAVSVAIPATSLWTHAMFSATASAQHAKDVRANSRLGSH